METAKARPYPSAAFDDLDQFAADVVQRLRDRVPSYDSVPFEEHVSFVEGQMRDMLDGVVHGRPPGPEHLARSEDLGWRRASQRVPVRDLMEAYHFCFREMWRRLVEVTDGAEHGGAELIASFDTLWSWTHGLSSAVANAHAEASRTHWAERAELRRRLFDAIGRGETEDPAVERLAAGLGFDANGTFQAICIPDQGQRSPDQIEKEFRPETASLGVMQIWAHDGVVTALCQQVDPGTITSVLAKRQVPIGVGLVRRGLAGARTSMSDAAMAVDVCKPGDVAFFADTAPLAVLFAGRASLEQALEAGARIARDHPQIAKTVMAFSRSFRFVDCARELHLHPNSAKYRLDRWTELTGWDVTTFAGLLRSVASIELFAGHRQGSPDGPGSLFD